MLCQNFPQNFAAHDMSLTQLAQISISVRSLYVLSDHHEKVISFLPFIWLHFCHIYFSLKLLYYSLFNHIDAGKFCFLFFFLSLVSNSTLFWILLVRFYARISISVER